MAGRYAKSMKSSGAQLELDILDENKATNFPDNEQFISWLERLKSVYLLGKLGGTVHEVYPAEPSDSRESYLYFTLAPALNFQRSSEGLWKSALATYVDSTTKFVFFPENVDRGLDDYRVALSFHRFA